MVNKKNSEREKTKDKRGFALLVYCVSEREIG
jgi:hypothetical protein